MTPGMSQRARKETPPADLRRQWRRSQDRKLERQCQLDLFRDREEAAEALKKLKELRRPVKKGGAS
jgi:hypothetical protein